jgi:hypothetical integral membrane protein (TIGR02206 family)
MNIIEAFIGERTDFVRFGFEHWTWILLYGVAFTYFWIRAAQKQDPATQQRWGFYHGMFGIISWVICSIVIYGVRGLYLSSLLPFHVCYMLNLILPFIHYKRSYAIFLPCYFWVMAACLQGVFTPDLDQSFPHYYNVRYFLVHIGLVQSILYAIFVYGFRPKAIGIVYALIVGNIYLGLVHLINLAIGTNFMYTVTRPPKTILDALGEHYLIEAQPLAMLLFAIVFLPFFIGNWSASKKMSSSY